MSIATIATIVFFGFYALIYFIPFQHAGIVLAITAGVIAIATAMRK